MPTQLTPGPGHPITLTAAPGEMIALYNGHAIATSSDVLMLQESTYPPVAYFPRADVEMAYMGRTAKTTHCPYKGDASYYTLSMDGKIAENAVWSYETPYPAMDAIKDRLAFYPNIVAVQAAGPREGLASAAGMDVNDIVRHTDSGAGSSQAESWSANVSEPPTTL